MSDNGDRKNRPEGDDRPRYEAPVLVPLGEMARGFGAACSMGTNAGGQGQGLCRDGGTAINCNTGPAATHQFNF